MPFTFGARDKAGPSGPKIRVGAEVRVRRDRIDNNGQGHAATPIAPSPHRRGTRPQRQAGDHARARLGRQGGV